MGHDSPHFFQQVGGKWRTCLCSCEECWQANGKGPACACSECNCTTKGPPLDKAYFKEETPKAEHLCTDCGTEVFRKNDRGRWPSRCPECKS